MKIPQILPQEAQKRLAAEPDWVYLDVRTAPEFVSGHVPGAFNVPITELNPLTGQMEPNVEFLNIVRAVAPVDTRIVVGCRSGPRSEMAVQLMQGAGYRQAVNLSGGFAGAVTSSGEVIEEGWSTLGFPIERGDGGKRSYEQLKCLCREKLA